MIRSLCMVLPLVVFSLLAEPGSAVAKTYQVYFLGGQSNMDGYGYTRDLPDDLKQSVPGVRIPSTAADSGPN